MTRVQWHESSGGVEIPGKGTARDHYAPGAFASAIGKRVPFRSRPGGPQVGWATVVDVTVDDDGLGATWTADIDLDGRDVVTPASSASFAFRQEPDDDAAVIRDPLAARPPVIREEREP